MDEYQTMWPATEKAVSVEKWVAVLQIVDSWPNAGNDKKCHIPSGV